MQSGKCWTKFRLINTLNVIATKVYANQDDSLSAFQTHINKS